MPLGWSLRHELPCSIGCKLTPGSPWDCPPLLLFISYKNYNNLYEYHNIILIEDLATVGNSKQNANDSSICSKRFSIRLSLHLITFKVKFKKSHLKSFIAI